MSGEMIKLLNLINEGKSIDEISKEVNLSHKQIYNRLTLLKNKGYEFLRKYYSNGDIVYTPDTSINNLIIGGPALITSSNETSIKLMVISDTHIGSVNENLDALNLIYEYCINNNIHVILHGGDIINGMVGSKSIHGSSREQIDYLLKKYPFNEHIINFMVLGNHDINSLISHGQNLFKTLGNERHDLIPLGYREGTINIKNERIILKHPIKLLDEKGTIYDNSLVLCGHRHKTKFTLSSNNQLIFLPSLSNEIIKDNQILPGAIEMTLNFQNGYFNSIQFLELLINNKVHIINEINCEVNRGKKYNEEKAINHEEERVKKLVITHNEGQLSQIDKFNKRYNM